jgi:hypothetical protein
LSPFMTFWWLYSISTKVPTQINRKKEIPIKAYFTQQLL